jgi:hypothetical protein
MKTFTTKADETPEFVALWDMWRPLARQTDGRGDARDTFFKHVRAGVDPKDIVDGARYFIRTLKDREYIPLAASWINKRAYEDLAALERAHQARISEAQSKRVEQIKRDVTEPIPAVVPPEEMERRRQMVARLRQEGILRA